jgi:hypothetical protein
MALRVVEVKSDNRNVNVVFEGETYGELDTAYAKQEAIKVAQQRIGLCGISNSTGPYPVDIDGNELKDFDKFAGMVKGGFMIRYRNEFTCTASGV